MNIVFVEGKLVNDPQVRQVNPTMKVVMFAVAVRDAGKKNTTSFFDVDAWNKVGDSVYANFVKGQTISLQGKLKQDSYQDKKTGNTIKKVKIVADKILNAPATVAVSNATDEQDIEEGSISF